MEEKLLLWLFHATNDKGNGRFQPCYARTEIEARQQESAWMAQQVNEGYDKITVKHSPHGFTVGTSTHLPGSIDESEVRNG